MMISGPRVVAKDGHKSRGSEFLTWAIGDSHPAAYDMDARIEVMDEVGMDTIWLAEAYPWWRKHRPSQPRPRSTSNNPQLPLTHRHPCRPAGRRSVR